MKSNKILFLCILLIVNETFAASKPINNIVAIVNNNVILESAVEKMIKIIKSQEYIHQSQISFYDQYLRRQIIERLIMNSIIEQEVNDYDNIKIQEKQIDQEIFRISLKNNISIDQIQKNLMFYNINFETYRKTIKKEIKISQAIHNFMENRINILPEDINSVNFHINMKKSVATKLNIDFIYIPLLNGFSQTENNQQKILATELMSKIKKNKNNMSHLIIKNKNKSILKTQTTGWVNIEDLPIFFSSLLLNAKKNEIIGPIETNSGFYILKIKNINFNKKKFFIHEMHLRHIMLKKSSTLTEKETKNKLEKISTDIKSGKITFDYAAKIFSEDLLSNNNGGDLGWNKINIFNSNFKNEILKIKKGGISKPIKSDSGWHIIQLLDMRKIDTTEEKQKQYAYQMLINYKMSEDIQAWLEELRNSFYIKVFN